MQPASPPAPAPAEVAAQRPVQPRLAFAALVGGSAVLALGPLFVRLADVGPVAAGFWRLSLAVPFLALLALREVRQIAVPGRGPLLLAVLAGLFFAADLASWHVGILMTKMANATLFGNAASIILAAWAIFVWRRLPHRWESVALVAAVGGAWLLMRESMETSRAHLVGDLLCLLAGTLYAGYMLAMQRARGQAGPWVTLCIASAAGSVPLLVAALGMGEAVLPQDWTPLILLALSSQLIGQGMMVYALPHFSPLVVGLALLLQPAVAGLVGWLSEGEVMTPPELLGAAMVGAALVLVRLPAPVARR